MQLAFRRVAARFDYAEIGGALLLGVNGVVIICHGRSNSLAITNAIRLAARAAQRRLANTLLSITPAPNIATPSPS
jgi:glycerol-3-phosphate acyltransferase PlsX